MSTENEMQTEMSGNILVTDQLNLPEERPLCDIYLLGAGISFPEHLTLQTIDILRRSKRVYTNLLQAEIDLLPAEIRRNFICIWDLYQENRQRSLNYDDIARTVLEGAALERPISWLTIGHPVVFDSVSQLLISSAAERQWTLDVLPAISSIDTVLAQLGFDCANGLVVYEATSIVEAQIPLQPYFATLLLQPSAFKTDVTQYTGEWRPDLRPLADHLLGFYPPSHQCAFVRSFSGQAGPASRSWRSIAEISEVPWHDLVGSSLFIPPLQ